MSMPAVGRHYEKGREKKLLDHHQAFSFCFIVMIIFSLHHVIYLILLCNAISDFRMSIVFG
jgi:hypothetical protein